MFKRIILLCVVLLAFCSVSVEARQVTVLNSAVAVGGCTPCTGGLVFAAYFEQDTDITNGDPCGCVDGTIFNDEVGTLNGDATIVTNGDGYVHLPGAEDWIEFDISNFDDSGSLLIKFHQVSHDSGTGLIKLFYDDDNHITVYFNASQDALPQWKGQTDVVAAALNGGNINTGTDYWMVVRWRTGASDPAIQAELYNVSETELESKSNNTNLTPMGTAPNKLQIGETGSDTGETKVYQLRIWDSYAGAPTSGF